jgi:hypothetical protein
LTCCHSRRTEKKQALDCGIKFFSISSSREKPGLVCLQRLRLVALLLDLNKRSQLGLRWATWVMVQYISTGRSRQLSIKGAFIGSCQSACGIASAARVPDRPMSSPLFMDGKYCTVIGSFSGARNVSISYKIIMIEPYCGPAVHIDGNLFEVVSGSHDTHSGHDTH